MNEPRWLDTNIVQPPVRRQVIVLTLAAFAAAFAMGAMLRESELRAYPLAKRGG